MSNEKPDTTRRTLAQARRAPQWQRLIDSIHKAQAAKGFEGRHFGAAEMESFGETLIGMPAEVGAYRGNFAAYWVARQDFEHSDGTHTVTYKLRAIYADDLADVQTIADASASDAYTDAETAAYTPEWDAATALDFVRRARFQTGANR
jgi:hypothetical protein